MSGGTKLGDRVRVSGNVSLLLFPEAKTYEGVAEESSSSSSVSQLVPPWEDEVEPTDDTAPAEVWGPPPGLTFEGVTVVDPTIPPGQSWNEESADSMPTYTMPVQAETVATSGSAPPWDTFDGQPPLPPPNDPPEATSPPSTSGLIAALQVQALVYVPDFVPEVVEISLEIPTAVQAACETVQDARLAYQSSSFPYLCAAVPQPAPAFAVFVAAPLWQNGTAVVLFDCLGYDGTLFAKSVHCRLSRESLLLAAGLPHDAAVHVYLRGSLHHLGIDQRTTLTTGDTVQIVRRGILPGTCHYLEDRLGTVELWNRNAELPGPRTHFNGCFQVLSEGAPFPFLVRPDGYSSFKKDLASSVGSEEHRLTLKTSVPRIVDSYPFGYWASGVIVATEALSRVPYPPARHHETRRILILDQRRILQGFSWRLVSGRVVPVQDVVGPFAALCPFGHTVLAHGAPTEQHGEEPAFIIQHGQVLTIEYRPVQEGGDVPASPWSDHAQHVPGTQQGMLFDRGDGDRHSGPSTGRTVSGNDRTRSRTPRQNGPSDTGATAPAVYGRAHANHSVKWGLDFKLHALAEGTPDLTPDSWKMLARLDHRPPIMLALNPDRAGVEEGPVAQTLCLPLKPLRLPFPSSTLWGFGSSPFRGWCSQCKLLVEPTSECAWTQHIMREARTATRLLGCEWPFPPYRWPLGFLDDDSDEPMSDHEGLGVQVDVTFYLLTPGHTPEKVEMTVILPQIVQDILDLVDICRDSVRKSLYPGLIVVEPQPDPGWGVLLAVPTWPRSQPVVCIDASLYDGRVFAVVVSRDIDFQEICEVAGLGPTAEVDIYLPNDPQPLPPHGVCVLSDGMCLTFRRRGARRFGTFNLPAMLTTHLPWEHSPVFPRDTLGNGYCVAGPQGQVLYRLHPERAFYYRSDIALLAGLHPFRTIVTPAVPQPTDVCIRGWECRTVVAATDRDDQVSWDGTVCTATVGLLDCRPLLIGWLPISSRDAWIDLRPIRATLSRLTPPGWQIVFPGLPEHWTWTCFVSGQVIVVALAPTVEANLETFLASLTAPDDLTSEGSDDELSRHEVNSTSNIVVPASSAPSASVAIGTGHERRLGVLALCCLFGLIALLPGEVFSSCAVGLCVFAVGGHPYLPALYLWHFLMGGGHLPVTAMQQPPWRGGYIPTREGEVCEFGGKVDTLWRRPVATPCRSRHAALGPLFHQEKDGGRHLFPEPIQEDNAPWKEPLVTLLEESSRRDDNWAFLAATLLDTLIDHFQTIGEQKASQRTPVSLAHHLPTAQIHDLTAVSFDFGVSFATAGQLVQPHSWILGHSVPSWLSRDAGADLLCAAPSGCVSHDEDLHIYTDGSFDGSCSSWAFAVIAHRNNSQRLAGWAAGRTVVDVEDPVYVGAQGHSPLVGEQCALLWAVAWALQAPHSHSIRFFADCEVALRQTTGRYGAHSTGGLAGICRCFFQALEAARPSFHADISHVKSHAGTVANELVDKLAKYACTPAWTTAAPSAFQQLVAAWSRSPHLPWLWTAFEAWRQPSLWPHFSGTGFVDKDRVSFSCPSARHCREYFGLAESQSRTSTLTTLAGDFCAFTLNTQTLADQQAHFVEVPASDHGFPGKVAFLRDQFDYYGATIVALQEARAAQDGMFISRTHIRICTGKDKQGNFGVELWLSRRHPFAWLGPTPVCFEPSHLLALFEPPRTFCQIQPWGLEDTDHCPTWSGSDLPPAGKLVAGSQTPSRPLMPWQFCFRPR